MVKISESDCLFEDTSLDGAAGSSATTTAPGAPGDFQSLTLFSLLSLSLSGIVATFYQSRARLNVSIVISIFEEDWRCPAPDMMFPAFIFSQSLERRQPTCQR